jgi:hypothetical protein
MKVTFCTSAPQEAATAAGSHFLLQAFFAASIELTLFTASIELTLLAASIELTLFTASNVNFESTNAGCKKTPQRATTTTAWHAPLTLVT